MLIGKETLKFNCMTINPVCELFLFGATYLSKMSTFCNDSDDNDEVTEVLDKLIQFQTTQFLFNYASLSKVTLSKKEIRFCSA